MIHMIEDIINGLLMGSIYGLTALGLTVMFGALKVINFAHGSLLMVAMYVAYRTVPLTGFQPYVALIFVVPIMFFSAAPSRASSSSPSSRRRKTSASHHRHHCHDRPGTSWTTSPC